MKLRRQKLSVVMQLRCIPLHAKDPDLYLYIAEIGDDPDMDVINEIATNESYVFRAADYESVQDLTVQIAERICFVGKSRDYITMMAVIIIVTFAVISK